MVTTKVRSLIAGSGKMGPYGHEQQASYALATYDYIRARLLTVDGLYATYSMVVTPETKQLILNDANCVVLA